MSSIMNWRTVREIPLTECERVTLSTMSNEALAAEFAKLEKMDIVPDLDWFEALEAEMVERVIRSRQLGAQ